MDNTIDGYDVGEFLGSGGFASVFRARRRSDGCPVAIKAIDKSSVIQAEQQPSEHGSNSASDISGRREISMGDSPSNMRALRTQRQVLARVRNEIRLHSALRHPCIIQLLTHFEDEDSIYLVLEVCEGGNLYRYLKRNGPLREDIARRVVAQVLAAVGYLHSRNIIHRDLKLSNILLCDEELNDSSQCAVKLCDFGLAEQLAHPDEEHFTICGTPNYLAPEVASQSAHSLPADLWAIGCLLYSMVTGSLPFEEEDVPATLERIMRDMYVEPQEHLLGAEGRDFLRQLLQKNPSKRSTAAQLLMHPFISGAAIGQEKQKQQGGRGESSAVSTRTRSKKKAAASESPSESAMSQTLLAALDAQVRRSVELAASQSGSAVHVPESVSSASSVTAATSRSSSSRVSRPEVSGRADANDHSLRPKRSNSPPPAASNGHIIATSRSSHSRRSTGSSGSDTLDRRIDVSYLSTHMGLGDKEKTVDLSRSDSHIPRYSSDAQSPYNTLSRDGVFHREGRSERISSKQYLRYDGAPSQMSFASTLASTDSAIMCHPPLRSSFHNDADGSLHVAAKTCPLLDPPSEPFVLKTPNNDVFICSADRDVAMCTRVQSQRGADNASVLIRIVVHKARPSRVFVSSLDDTLGNTELETLLRLYDWSARGRASDGDTDATPPLLRTDAFQILSDIASPGVASYSLRDLPPWLEHKYMRLHSCISAIKCRIPKFVMYVSDIRALQEGAAKSGSPMHSSGNAAASTYDCKCMLMSNDPMPDFCVQWSDGVKLRYALQTGHLHLSTTADVPKETGRPRVLYHWTGPLAAGGGGGDGPDDNATPSWAQSAPQEVRKYLLCAQTAMLRCLQESDRHFSALPPPRRTGAKLLSDPTDKTISSGEAKIIFI